MKLIVTLAQVATTRWAVELDDKTSPSAVYSKALELAKLAWEDGDEASMDGRATVSDITLMDITKEEDFTEKDIAIMKRIDLLEDMNEKN